MKELLLCLMKPWAQSEGVNTPQLIYCMCVCVQIKYRAVYDSRMGSQILTFGICCVLY